MLTLTSILMLMLCGGWCARAVGDQVTNLREDIFTHRVRYSLTTTMDEAQREGVLAKAVRSLEK